MSFPLANPKAQFFDSSGAPLASGTIEFRNPDDDTYIDTYPTADDADAGTNANANPLTLNSRGEAASGIYLQDGVKYKITLREEWPDELTPGTVVWTQDDVLCPIALPYLQTAAEAAAGVTPTNLQYEPGNLLRYGATGDGSTDDSTAIQTWVTFCAGAGITAYAPAGHYKHASTITQKVAGSRLTMVGDGRCAQSDWPSTASGTVFEYTGSTGNGWEFGDGSTTNIRGFNVRDMSFWATTTGAVMSCNTIQDGNRFSNLLFGNSGTGSGLVILDMWVSGVSDIFCIGVGSATSLGTGFQWANDGNAAGVGYCLNVTGKAFKYGVLLGVTDTSGKGLRAITANIQGLQCDEGVNIAGIVTDSEITAWTENNDTCGLRIWNGATANNIKVYGSEPTATEASVVFGKSGGTATERLVARTRISGTVANIDTAGVGIQVYGSASANDNIIDRVALSPETASNGTGIVLDNNSTQGWEIIRPTYGSLATNITGDGNTDLYTLSDYQGLQTHRNAVNFVRLQLPTRTTTQLEDVTHDVNTNAAKVEGAVVFNTTTNKPVYAAGSADADVWVDATGATAHSPV
jgi:hypothetical protein